MQNLSDKTLAAIVTDNHRTVAVMEKYNLDFCCNGKRTLFSACEEKGLNTNQVTKELEDTFTNKNISEDAYLQTSPVELINHIVRKHHFYVKQSMPQIIAHLQKVVGKHGGRFPYMADVAELFHDIQEEMLEHMHKEETILFPAIKTIISQPSKDEKYYTAKAIVNSAINVMEAEHQSAGDKLYSIRNLTNNYMAPEDACTTFRILLSELKEFEEDLHQHVHLENNILFPLALTLPK